MTNLNTGSLTHSWIQKHPYRNGDIRRDIQPNDFQNGNALDIQNPISMQENVETLLHRIAFTVWHTALHIEREVRQLGEINSRILRFY